MQTSRAGNFASLPYMRPVGGDLFALVRLVLPDPLSEQEVNSIRELVSSRGNTAQSHPDEAKV